jgi:sugar phosphate isomerase/epimerase
MKIAFTTLACPDWTLDEVIEHGAAAGYDAVDFRGLDGQMGVFVLPEFTDDADATRGKLDQAGLEISCFSSGAKMYNPDPRQRGQSLSEVGEYAKLCRRFEVGFIRVFGGRVPEGVWREEAIDQGAEMLEQMARLACPTVIAVETHDDWVDSSLLREVMLRVEAENVGVLWDLHHPYRLQGESPRQTYENLGRWVVYTHVKDGRQIGDRESRYVLPGQGGDVPLAEMVDLLKSGGYDGYLTLEWEKKWHPEIAEPAQALPAYARYLKQFV